ncbi:MAG: polysaccharide deacetylase family protein [Bacteroidetes bacterium]|nr:polysaccharide deacetylase family protein [Bacteroidota bacterium]
MKISKKIARNVVLPIIVNLGLEKVLRSFAKHSILNIMFHGVVSRNGNFFSPRHIPVEQFDRILRYLSKEFALISINEAFHYYRNNLKPTRRTITVSFDDGYKNNLLVVLPLIEKYKIKATFFISSACIDEHSYPFLWADALACLKYFHQQDTVIIDDLKFTNLVEESSQIHLSGFLKEQGALKRDSILGNLCTKFDIVNKIRKIPSELWELLSTKEIKQLSDSKLVEIGSHGHLHYNLANIDRFDAYNDMQKSKILLESVLDKQVESIAYPDGSYNMDIINMATEIGFTSQLAVNYLNESDRNDPRILNRHGISATTTFESNIFTLNKTFSKKGFS